MTSSSNFGFELGRISINVDFDGFIVNSLLSHQRFNLSRALLDIVCKSSRLLLVKVNLHSIRFSCVFVRFFTFLLLLDKVCAFSSAFYVSISGLTRQSHTGQKFSEKIFL